MTGARLAEYLEQMHQAASQACLYVEAMDKADFLGDKRTQQAVILNIVILGEVATRLLKDYPDFVQRYPQVPWRSMKGMRNRIAHGYFDIDLDIVWETVKSALPALLHQLQALRSN